MHVSKATSARPFAGYRRTVFVSAAMLSLVLTTACGAASPSNSAESAKTSVSATASPATESEKASAPPAETEKTPTAIHPGIAGRTITRLEQQGIEIGDVVEVKNGSYPQYKVTKKSHLAKFDESKHSDGIPAGWKMSDIAEAQIVASEWMTNFALDNQTLNDYEANKSKLADAVVKIASSKYKDEFKETVLKKGGAFNQDTFTEKTFTGDRSKGFRYVSDGVTPRIADLSQLKVVSSQNWDGGVYFIYQGYVTMNVVDKKKNPYTMLHNVEFGMTVTKEKGQYKMYGLNCMVAQYMFPEPA